MGVKLGDVSEPVLVWSEMYKLKPVYCCDFTLKRTLNSVITFNSSEQIVSNLNLMFMKVN